MNVSVYVQEISVNMYGDDDGTEWRRNICGTQQTVRMVVNAKEILHFNTESEMDWCVVVVVFIIIIFYVHGKQLWS